MSKRFGSLKFNKNTCEIIFIFRHIFCVILIFVINCFELIKAKQIACESIYAYRFSDPMGSLNTCWIYQSTTINTTGITLTSTSNEVTAISFWRSNQIFFLPENISVNFPNLTFYDAYNNALNEVTKSNFNSLTRVRWLHLSENKLERIANNTFEDMTALEHLFLSELSSNIIIVFLKVLRYLLLKKMKKMRKMKKKKQKFRLSMIINEIIDYRC